MCNEIKKGIMRFIHYWPPFAYTDIEIITIYAAVAFSIWAKSFQSSHYH